MTPDEKIEQLKQALDDICQMTYTTPQGWSHTPYCKIHMGKYAQIHAAAARALREIDSDQ